MLKPGRIIFTLALILCSTGAFAQNRFVRAGIINSPKGFGVAAQLPTGSESILNSVYITADLEGVLEGVESLPGIKFTYLHQNVLKSGAIRDDVDYSLYIGGGFSGGFVRDFGSENLNHGLMLGMAAGTGVLFTFRGNIDIAIDVTGEFGLHLREDEKYSTLDLAWYENGVVKALIPQLIIYYKF